MLTTCYDINDICDYAFCEVADSIIVILTMLFILKTLSCQKFKYKNV